MELFIVQEIMMDHEPIIGIGTTFQNALALAADSELEVGKENAEYTTHNGIPMDYVSITEVQSDTPLDLID